THGATPASPCHRHHTGAHVAAGHRISPAHHSGRTGALPLTGQRIPGLREWQARRLKAGWPVLDAATVLPWAPLGHPQPPGHTRTVPGEQLRWLESRADKREPRQDCATANRRPEG